MEQSLLAELIRTLNSEEKNQILEFAGLKFFNNGRMKGHVLPLLEICLNHFSGNTEQKLEKRVVYSTIFPNQPFVEGKLEKLMVEAHSIIKKFLLVQRYFRAENEFNQVIEFSKEASERKLSSHYEQSVAKLHKIQQAGAQSSPEYFRRQFLLEFSIHEEETVKNRGKGELNIPNTIQALELDYYLNLLILLNQYLLQLKITRLEVPLKINNLVETLVVPDACIEGAVAVRLYYETFRLLKMQSPTADDVQKHFELLKRHEGDLDFQTLSNSYAFLRNLCVLALSADHDQLDMAFTLHNLYQDNLYRGFLHCEGTISRSKYMAVSNNALFIGEYDWALAFIEKYKNEIEGDNETKDAYRLNLANYQFKVGRYSECLDNIPSTSPSIVYMLMGKRLELKSLFEMKSDLLSYKLDAFKMFLSRTSPKILSEASKQTHSDFANFLHQLINSRPGDQNRQDILIQRLMVKKQSAEWRWLLEKAKALAGR